MTNADVKPEFYNDELQQKLISTFEVQPELQQEFIKRLESAALIWQQEKAAPFMPDVDWTRMSRFWKDIVKQSDRLVDIIANRPHFVDVRMRNGLQSKIDMHAFSVMLAERDNQPAPAELNLRQIDVIQPKDLSNLRSKLGALRSLAEEELEALPSNKAGRKPDYALSLWMTNMYNLWTEKLGRSFTRQIHGRGIPVSPAARFVVEAFKPLDPEMPASQVLTQMQHTISRYSNRR